MPNSPNLQKPRSFFYPKKGEISKLSPLEDALNLQDPQISQTKLENPTNFLTIS